MNALNIMWLLNEIDCNTEIEILTGKSKHVDSIFVSTDEFDFSISECGSCKLDYQGQDRSVEKDVEYWNKVKDCVKKIQYELVLTYLPQVSELESLSTMLEDYLSKLHDNVREVVKELRK